MTAMDLVEAVALRLAAHWPERMIYRDFCPIDFARPSCFLWLAKWETKDLNAVLVEHSAELRLELFCSTDRYAISSTQALREEQADVLALFAEAKLPVSEWDTNIVRHVSVSLQADGQAAGSAFLVFRAVWTDVRAEHKTVAHEPMQHYALRHGAAERTSTL